MVRLSALRAGGSLSPGRFLVLISVRGWVDHRAIVRLEGLGQLKYPITLKFNGIKLLGCINSSLKTNGELYVRKVKVKFPLCLMTEAPGMGNRGIAPRILNLGNEFDRLVSFALQTLFTLGRDPYTHWTRCWVGPKTELDTHKGEKSLVPTQNRNPMYRPFSPQTVATPRANRCR
jgi:hypothetical protein